MLQNPTPTPTPTSPLPQPLPLPLPLAPSPSPSPSPPSAQVMFQNVITNAFEGAATTNAGVELLES